jgi:hypothetical protein
MRPCVSLSIWRPLADAYPASRAAATTSRQSNNGRAGSWCCCSCCATFLGLLLIMLLRLLDVEHNVAAPPRSCSATCSAVGSEVERAEEERVAPATCCCARLDESAISFNRLWACEPSVSATSSSWLYAASWGTAECDLTAAQLPCHADNLCPARQRLGELASKLRSKHCSNDATAVVAELFEHCVAR